MKRIRLLFILISILCYGQNSFAQYTGGSEDGFSSNIGCIQKLNGVSALIPGPIVGSSEFCAFATESYSITVSGINSSTVYLWNAPAGAIITSGQGTNSVLITFGNTPGNVSVDISNECLTVNQLLAVTLGSCAFFSGGSNDGFGSNIGCIQNLNGGSSFIPGPIVGSSEFCAFATEAYSIAVAGSTSSTGFVWTVPVGATITSGQGTNSVLITFGNSPGNVRVDVSNECETVNQILPVSTASCTFFSGGSNDGFSANIGCIQNLNGGSSFIPGPIIGSSEFCSFATEAYSITVAGATSTTGYVWTVPVGATITSGQGTNSVLITFGNNSGNISVDISNECETVNQILPVSTASCTFFSGGSNDGFSSNIGCIQNLNGGSAFSPGPIVGSIEFCAFATEAYSISVAGATATTVYTWTVPTGATVTSGQGTNSILVTFGNTAGNISVDISNECETVNTFLSVSISSCLFYRGGFNDGFSVTTTSINIPLPIELLSFHATVLSGEIKLSWTTGSEHNNDFFEVEKSRDGIDFVNVNRVEGAGTSNQLNSYFTVDKNPFFGLSYYRLAQTDFDKTKTYSELVSVYMEGEMKSTPRLHPNPVRIGDDVHLDYFTNVDQPINVSVNDPLGKTIMQNEYFVKAGINKLEFEADFESVGVYIIQIIDRERIYVFRLIVMY